MKAFAYGPSGSPCNAQSATMARDGAATTEPPFSVRLDRGSAVQRASIGIVQRAVEDWLAVARHPRFDRPYDELTYRPMQELLALLRARGFRTWIVSGGGADFMRVWSERVRRPAVGEPPAPARLVFNDATNVYRLPDGTFEMYSVGLIKVAKDDPRYIAHDNAAGSLRVIDRYTSTDGLDWTDRRRVLVPDAQDPIDQQFYLLPRRHPHPPGPGRHAGPLPRRSPDGGPRGLRVHRRHHVAAPPPPRADSSRRTGRAGQLRDLRAPCAGAAGWPLAPR